MGLGFGIGLWFGLGLGLAPAPAGSIVERRALCEAAAPGPASG